VGGDGSGAVLVFLLLVGINTGCGERVGIYVALVAGERKRNDGARTLRESRVVPFTPENVFFGRAQEWPPQMFSLFIQKFCILCDKNYSEDVMTGIPTDVKLLCRMQGVKGTQ
jgi:hypothetical protein